MGHAQYVADSTHRSINDALACNMQPVTLDMVSHRSYTEPIFTGAPMGYIQRDENALSEGSVAKDGPAVGERVARHEGARRKALIEAHPG